MKSLSVSQAQHLCNVNYEDEVAFLAVVGEKEKETIIGSACYYVDPSTNLAEVAYIIHPQWQDKGLGTVLQERLMEYARCKGLHGLKADVLSENKKMLRLIEKSGCRFTISSSSGVCEIEMIFD